MSGAVDRQQMGIFLLRARSLPLGSNVIAAELGRNCVVGRSMNQPLPRLPNRDPHGISFAVMVGNAYRRSSQKLNNGVIAEMKLISSLQIYNSGQRNHPRDTGLMCSEAKSKLAASRMPHHDNLVAIDVVLARILHKKIVGCANVGERRGPRAAFIPDAAVFEVRRHKSLRCERRAQVPGMIEIVASPPISTVNVDDEGRWACAFVFRRTQIEKLIRIGPVADSRVGRRWGESENVVGHVFRYSNSLLSESYHRQRCQRSPTIRK
jgi:hypothetical protein